MKLFRRCLVLCILILPNILHAATYYANSGTGLDTYAGTSSSAPFKTFTKAYTTASSGDIISLIGTFTWTDAAETGTSTEGFTITKNVTIIGPTGSFAVLQAATSAGSASKRVLNISANVTLQNLEIRYGYLSTTSGCGAGAYIINTGYTVTFDKCYLHDNFAYNGSALCSNSTSTIVTITNSTISNNTGSSSSSGDSYAGAVYLQTATTAYITNTTICNNSGADFGGAITINPACPCTVTNCTLAGNTVYGFGGGIEMMGPLTIKNTIVANNTATVTPSTNDIDFYSGTLTDNGYNIIETSAVSGSITGSLAGTDITGNQSNLFGTGVSATPSLATNNTSNGTMTIKLTSGSVALNAGSSTANGSVSIPTTDQRGALRKGSVDIGAYEYWSDAGALPAELKSFTATATSNAATLAWKTATEVNNYGFEVERRAIANGESSMDNWTEIGFVAGNGTSNTEHTYSYSDANVSAGTYAYRLKQIDNDGTSTYSSEAETTIDLPKTFTLNQNYPNPFNPSTAITFTLAKDGFTTLKVYDVLGKEVATLVNGEMKAGVQNSVTFGASKLSSGVYFSRLESNGQVQMKKLMLVK